MFNKNKIEGNWNQFKGGIQTLWGKITDDDLEQVNGNLTKLYGIIQEKYGDSIDEVEKKLSQLSDSYDNPTDKGIQPDETSFERNPLGEKENRKLH